MKAEILGIMPGLIFVSDPPDLEAVRGRIGVISGSFDPPTNAHLALAEALNDNGCELVLMLYSLRTLPKEERSHVPGGSAEPPLLDHEERARCLSELSRRRDWLVAAVCMESLIEEQALLVARAFPNARPVFGVGSDKLIQIFDPSWYDDRDSSLERLFAAVELDYAVRAGEEEELRRTIAENPKFAPAMKEVVLPLETQSIASREIRRKVSSGEATDDVPEEVLPIVMGAVGADG